MPSGGITLGICGRLAQRTRPSALDLRHDGGERADPQHIFTGPFETGRK
jgi:hypothetical protein